MCPNMLNLADAFPQARAEGLLRLLTTSKHHEVNVAHEAGDCGGHLSEDEATDGARRNEESFARRLLETKWLQQKRILEKGNC